MKKSKLLLGITGISLVAAGIFCGIDKGSIQEITNENVSAEGERPLSGDVEEWGRYLAQRAGGYSSVYSLGKDEDIYAIGENSTIFCKDIEQAKMYYIIAGLGEGMAESEAEKHVYEREALYQEALRKGYDITEEELEEYLRQLKETMEQAENKEMIQTIIQQFPSEEAYWEYEFSVYQKNLPIEKYVQDLMSDYMKISEHNIEGWEDYYSQWKEELIKKENYKKI